MEIFWYILIAILLNVFFVLDGYDFGVGIIHLFFAKTDDDKVVISKAAGLFWDSNEVWLVAAGGMLFMAFPIFYASIFSGFYLPLIIVLWLIVFRAIGLEFRSQFKVEIWTNFWDTAFGLSSLLLALFFGIALGNIIRGVNLGAVQNGESLHEAHFFFLPLWTDLNPLNENPGVIDGFTIIIGLIAIIVLAIHGANWLILKTNASINPSLKNVIFRLNFVHLFLSIIALVVLSFINPKFFENFLSNPFFLLFPILYLSGLVGLFFIRRIEKEIYGFALSTMVIVGGIMTSLLSIFPTILPSTNTVNGPLTIYNTASNAYAQTVALPWGIAGCVLIVIYFIVQRRLNAGKIDTMDYGH